MTTPPDWLTFWSVPRCWPGSTVAVMAGGPSLTDEVVDTLHHAAQYRHLRVVAINRAYVLAPWADWLWGCDPGRFWAWCGGPGRLYGSEPDAWDFEGEKIVLWSPQLSSEGRLTPHLEHLRTLVEARPEVKVLCHAGDGHHEGWSGKPDVVFGNNGLYQVLSMLPHTGARKVILVGADMKSGHWHKPWPMGEPTYENSVVPNFRTLVDPLAQARLDVVNCTPGSALDAFRCGKLLEELV